MDLEHEVAQLIFKQEQYGFSFNRVKAEELYIKLKARSVELEEDLQKVFKPIVKERWSTKTGKRLKDLVIVFNPSSRHHIAERLKESQNNAAILTTFNEVDMSAIMQIRKQYKDIFEKKC